MAVSKKTMFLGESFTCNALFAGLSISATAIYANRNKGGVISDELLTVFELPYACYFCACQMLMTAFLWRCVNNAKKAIPVSIWAYMLYCGSGALCIFCMCWSLFVNSSSFCMGVDLLVIPIVFCVIAFWRNPGIGEVLPCILITAGHYYATMMSGKPSGRMMVTAQLCFLTSQQFTLLGLRWMAEKEGSVFDVIDFHVKSVPVQACILILLASGMVVKTHQFPWLETVQGWYVSQKTVALPFFSVQNLCYMVFVICPASILIVSSMYLSIGTEDSPFDETDFESHLFSREGVPNIKALFGAILFSRALFLVLSIALPKSFNIDKLGNPDSPIFCIIGSLLVLLGGSWHSTIFNLRCSHVFRLVKHPKLGDTPDFTIVVPTAEKPGFESDTKLSIQT